MHAWLDHNLDLVLRQGVNLQQVARTGWKALGADQKYSIQLFFFILDHRVLVKQNIKMPPKVGYTKTII